MPDIKIIATKDTIFDTTQINFYYTGEEDEQDGSKKIKTVCGCCCVSPPELLRDTFFYGTAIANTFGRTHEGEYYPFTQASISYTDTYSSPSVQQTCTIDQVLSSQPEDTITAFSKVTVWEVSSPPDYNGYVDQTCTSVRTEDGVTTTSTTQVLFPKFCFGAEISDELSDGTLTRTNSSSYTSPSGGITETCSSTVTYSGIIPIQTLWGIAKSNFLSGSYTSEVAQFRLYGDFGNGSASVGGIRTYKIVYDDISPTGYLKVWLRRKTWINDDPEPTIVDVPIILSVGTVDNCGDKKAAEESLNGRNSYVTYDTTSSLPNVEETEAESGSFSITFELLYYSYLEDYEPIPNPATGGYFNGFPPYYLELEPP